MSLFGWDYPPGAAGDPYAPYNQDDGEPCEVCGSPAGECICHECPTCEAYGDPACYDARGVNYHGLILSPEQISGRAELEARYDAQAAADRAEAEADQRLSLEEMAADPDGLIEQIRAENDAALGAPVPFGRNPNQLEHPAPVTPIER